MKYILYKCHYIIIYLYTFTCTPITLRTIIICGTGFVESYLDYAFSLRQKNVIVVFMGNENRYLR